MRRAAKRRKLAGDSDPDWIRQIQAQNTKGGSHAAQTCGLATHIGFDDHQRAAVCGRDGGVREHS